MQLPPRKIYPDYYQVILDPMALDVVKKKLDSLNYTSLGAVKRDIDLMFNNAKLYNVEGSGIYMDAADLQVDSSLVMIV